MVMVCARIERREKFNLSLNREILEEVASFKYLGASISMNGSAEENMEVKVDEGIKVSGAMSYMEQRNRV